MEFNKNNPEGLTKKEWEGRKKEALKYWENSQLNLVSPDSSREMLESETSFDTDDFDEGDFAVLAMMVNEQLLDVVYGKEYDLAWEECIAEFEDFFK